MRAPDFRVVLHAAPWVHEPAQVHRRQRGLDAVHDQPQVYNRDHCRAVFLAEVISCDNPRALGYRRWREIGLTLYPEPLFHTKTRITCTCRQSPCVGLGACVGATQAAARPGQAYGAASSDFPILCGCARATLGVVGFAMEQNLVVVMQREGADFRTRVLGSDEVCGANGSMAAERAARGTRRREPIGGTMSCLGRSDFGTSVDLSRRQG
jgi:hypothetical protein